MKSILQFGIIVVVVLQFTTAPAQDSEAQLFPAPPERIKMYPGETREIRAPAGHRQLYVSRRGIIDLTQVGPGRWHLIALKKGIVTLQYDSYASESGPPPQKFHIEVGSVKEKQQVLPQKIGPEASHHGAGFYLQAWLVVDETTHNSHHGLPPNIKILFQQTPRLTPKQFHDQLAMASTNVLAAPQLVMSTGQPVSIASGGEFRSSESGRDGILPIWKEYGTTFTFTASPGRGDSLHLTYEVDLKDLGNNGGQQILSGGRYRGQIELTLDKTQLLGSMDVHSDRRGQDLSFYFGKLPILGPLFTRHGKQTRRSKLYLFVHIAKL